MEEDFSDFKNGEVAQQVERRCEVPSVSGSIPDLSTRKCKCILCGNEFNSKDGYNRKKCGGCRTKIRRYKNKKKAIKLLGGKCRCGYAFDGKNIAAFEFHHRDPNEKDFKIGQCANKSWKVLLEELKKCDLLCSNCHNIEHSNITDWLLEE